MIVYRKEVRFITSLEASSSPACTHLTHSHIHTITDSHIEFKADVTSFTEYAPHVPGNVQKTARGRQSGDKRQRHRGEGGLRLFLNSGFHQFCISLNSKSRHWTEMMGGLSTGTAVAGGTKLSWNEGKERDEGSTSGWDAATFYDPTDC